MQRSVSQYPKKRSRRSLKYVGAIESRGLSLPLTLCAVTGGALSRIQLSACQLGIRIVFERITLTDVLWRCLFYQASSPSPSRRAKNYIHRRFAESFHWPAPCL